MILIFLKYLEPVVFWKIKKIRFNTIHNLIEIKRFVKHRNFDHSIGLIVAKIKRMCKPQLWPSNLEPPLAQHLNFVSKSFYTLRCKRKTTSLTIIAWDTFVPQNRWLTTRWYPTFIKKFKPSREPVYFCRSRWIKSLQIASLNLSLPYFGTNMITLLFSQP